MQKAKEEQKALWRKVNDVYVTNLVAPHDEAVKFIEKAWKKFAKKQPHPSRPFDLNITPKCGLRIRQSNRVKTLKGEFVYFMNEVHFTLGKEPTWKGVAHLLSHWIAYYNIGDITHTPYQYMLEKQVAEFGSGRFWNKLSE